MVEAADDPSHEQHCGDAGEIEHLRSQADDVRCGRTDPPDWTHALIRPTRLYPRSVAREARCPKGGGSVSASPTHTDTAEDLIAATNASTLAAYAIETLGSGFDGAANRQLEHALDRRLELAELWDCELSDLRSEMVRRGMVDPGED